VEAKRAESGLPLRPLIGDLPRILAWPVEAPVPMRATTELPSPRSVVRELVTAAAGPLQICNHGNVRYLMKPGEFVDHLCLTNTIPVIAKLQLVDFRKQFPAVPVPNTPENEAVFHIDLPPTFLQSCFGRSPQLEVQVRFLRPPSD